jgi:ABC-type glutathione transport system ATPase component
VDVPVQLREVLIEVRDLTVMYHLPNGQNVTALDRISLGIRTGEVVGALGESGSGKSTLALSILRLLPANAEITAGTIRICGQDVLTMPERRLQQLRGAQVAMVFQNPGMALNPTMRVSRQVAEVIHAHRRWNWPLCRSQAKLVLEQIFGGDADRISDAYPYELSGGECQRVSIAQAFACHPSLVIGDEPTASLDAVAQAALLDLFLQLKRFSSMSLLFITHNPSILPALADRVVVLRRGQVVEEGDLRAVYRNPASSYTIGLLHSVLEPLRI